ncbi:MAG: hypothetical protein Q9217_000529 [Psora testacea]
MLDLPSGFIQDNDSQGMSLIGSMTNTVDTLVAQRRPIQAFPFFDLPSELRSKILRLLLVTEATIDLHPQNYRSAHERLNLFFVSQRMHEEASHIFYSGNTFRIFPTHSRYFGNKTVPLVTRLPQKYRVLLTSLELRLGPGWGSPPKSWRVHNGLCLEEMENVRIVKVFIEVDPSQDIFHGFREGKTYYTEFSRHLLAGVMQRLPSLQGVEFDGWPSVRMRGGTLMDSLAQVVRYSDLEVCLLDDGDTSQKWNGCSSEGGEGESVLVS